MAVKEKLIEHVKQLSARVTELGGEKVKGKETVADLNVKMKATEKRAKYVAY